MPNHPHPIDIAELRRLHEAADLGELSYQEVSDAYTHIVRRNGSGFVVQFPQDTTGRAEARARLFASLAHLPALLDRIKAETWQPIETAPKDGTSILAIVAGTHPQTGEPFVPEVVEWDEADTCWWNCMWGYDNAHNTYEPTHWRPLPAAPTTVGANV